MPSCWFRKQLTRRLSKLFSEGLPLNCNSFTFDGAQWLITLKSATSVTIWEFLQKTWILIILGRGSWRTASAHPKGIHKWLAWTTHKNKLTWWVLCLPSSNFACVWWFTCTGVGFSYQISERSWITPEMALKRYSWFLKTHSHLFCTHHPPLNAASLVKPVVMEARFNRTK